MPVINLHSIAVIKLYELYACQLTDWLTFCLFIYLQDNLKFVGHDINVTGVWERNITGKGVIVSVIDDGEFVILV